MLFMMYYGLVVEGMRESLAISVYGSRAVFRHRILCNFLYGRPDSISVSGTGDLVALFFLFL